MKILPTVICLTLFVAVAVRAQGDYFPIDEFRKVSCEDLMARVDNLGIQLTLVKGETLPGYVVFLRNGPEATKQDWQMKFIHRKLISRFGNHLNVTFLRKIADGEPITQFWITPPSSILGEMLDENAEVKFRIPFKIERRTLFGEDGPDPCSEHVASGFVKMLKSDPSLTGYVVSVNYPQKDYAALIEYYLVLLRENGLGDRGVRFYFKKKKMPGHPSYGLNEYWLLPKKK
ncbi:MAG: hypothetical protein IT171_06770 [Acidobacteria bacterium]|nr:hypothetical protein [Acidobacteriota bacterium]